MYGYVTEKIYDPDNEPCQTAYLLEDGVTIIPSGGFALKTVVNGQEVSKKDLVAVDENMNPLVPISSIFDKDVVLKTDATLEDYLSLNVTSVYQLEITQGKGAGMKYPDDVIQIVGKVGTGFQTNSVPNYCKHLEGCWWKLSI